MLSGIDTHGDEIGLVPHEAFVCGNCMKGMAELGNRKYQCPKCSSVFQDC